MTPGRLVTDGFFVHAETLRLQAGRKHGVAGPAGTRTVADAPSTLPADETYDRLVVFLLLFRLRQFASATLNPPHASSPRAIVPEFGQSASPSALDPVGQRVWRRSAGCRCWAPPGEAATRCAGPSRRSPAGPTSPRFASRRTRSSPRAGGTSCRPKPSAQPSLRSRPWAAPHPRKRQLRQRCPSSRGAMDRFPRQWLYRIQRARVELFSPGRGSAGRAGAGG